MLRVVLVILILACASVLPAAESDQQVLAAARLANDQYQRHIGVLLRSLESAAIEDRVEALRALGHTADQAVVPRLIPYLDPDVRPAEVVIAAIHALASLGASEAAPAISKLTEREEQPIRLAALNALSQLKTLGAADYQRESGDQNPNVRGMAITELGTLEVKEAGSTLAEALHDPRSHIRRMAAIGLGRLGDPQHGQALTEALTDSDPMVRRYAAESLIILDYKPAIPYLLMALEAGIAGGDIRRALIALSGQDFGYHPKANPVANRLAVNRGFEWWTEHASDFD